MDTLTEQELFEAAREAWMTFKEEDPTGTQEALSERIGVNRSAVSRALRETGRGHAAVQARIVSHVRGVPVQKRSTYQSRRVRHRWIIGPELHAPESESRLPGRRTHPKKPRTTDAKQTDTIM